MESDDERYARGPGAPLTPELAAKVWDSARKAGLEAKPLEFIGDGAINRVYNDQLRGLDRNGRPCEACDGPTWLHEWADMDGHGFIVNCPYIQDGWGEDR